MNLSFYFLLLIVFIITSCNTIDKQSEQIWLKNENIEIGINSFGGAISFFSPVNSDVNFLSWKLNQDDMPENNRNGAPFQGHFLCYGRWGAPTEGEIKAGIPHNGEHNNKLWRTEKSADNLSLTMHVKAEMDQVNITRKIRLAKDQGVFKVRETFEHTSGIGRLCNIVQHLTLGPPFLNTSLRIYSNCQEGFLQVNSFPDPGSKEYVWPEGRDEEGNSFDLRKFQTGINFVSTHIINDSCGWVIAIDSLSRYFMGYVWSTEDYPWINLWNHNEEGSPAAYGMEFGTTGIGRPYPDLVSNDVFFHGKNSYFFMDAGQEIVKEYYGFSGQVEDSSFKVEDIRIDSLITIIFKSTTEKGFYSINYPIDDLIDN
jgi:hypothetical protein